MPRARNHSHKLRGSITGTQPGKNEPPPETDDQVARSVRRPASRRCKSQHPIFALLRELADDPGRRSPVPAPPASRLDPTRLHRKGQIAVTRDSENPVIRARIIERDRGVCQICGERVDSTDINLDHIIPLSRGGRHVPENVQLTHSRCNIEKADSLPSDRGPTIPG